jgi:hypothetical protein
VSVHWHRVRTISGKDAGLAFDCDRCALRIPYHAPAVVDHCSTFSQVPLPADIAKLPTRSLGGGQQWPSGIIPCFETTEKFEMPEKEPPTEVGWV